MIKLEEELALAKVLKRCRDLSTDTEQLHFLGWKDNRYSGIDSKLRLHSTAYGYWENTNYYNFITGKKGYRPTRFTESNVRWIIDRVCKEISTEEEKVIFVGFSGEFDKTETTTILLKNTKLNLTWSTNLGRFIRNKPKQPRVLTEKIARDLILEKCRRISSPKETITFVGFVGGQWNGAKETKIIIHNSFLNEFWISCYSTFVQEDSRMTKPKHTKDEEYQMSRILGVCEEISTPDEKISFLGWAEPFIGNLTRVKLHNSKYDVTWDTTLCSNFVRLKNKLPHNKERKDLLGEKHLETYTDTFKKRQTTEGFIKKYLDRGHEFTYDLSEAEFISYSVPMKVICHELDSDGNEHGEFFMTPSSLLSGCRCPKCRSVSKGEKIIEQYLNSKELSFRPQVLIDSSDIENCPNLSTVKIDFEISFEGRKIWIEFNGDQHYSYMEYMHHGSVSTFHRQLFRDLSVIRYCAQNNIELLEIPYCDLDRIPEILDKFLGEGIDITTKVVREIWSGPSLPLGLPYKPNI